jgi:DNA-binding HxlR family transcriptional regulator
MRSYSQYCALARALDVVGERWTMLVVRELLDGPRRYAELLDGLPGIASNLLADRLRSLQAAGVAERQTDGRYALTPWGRDLREPIYALGRWAAPLMPRSPGSDAFRSRWLAHMVLARSGGARRRRGEVTVEIRCGSEATTVFTEAGEIRMARGSAIRPDVTLDGPPHALIGLITGALDEATAQALGVAVSGDPRKLDGLRPGRGAARTSKSTESGKRPSADEITG